MFFVFQFHRISSGQILVYFWLVSYEQNPIMCDKRYKRCPGRDSAQKSLKIWAVWAVFQQDLSGLSGLGGFFFGKTAQILLKKPLKNRSFLAAIFERFFKQDMSGF